MSESNPTSSCRETVFGSAESATSFAFGLVEIIIMILFILALKFKSTASSWYHGETGVKEGVTLFLPIYYPICFYTIVYGLFTGVVLIANVGPYSNAVVLCIKWSAIRFCSESLSIFFMHNGIGERAIRTSLLGGLFWSTITGSIPLILYFTTSAPLNFLLFVGSFAISDFILMVFYILAWFLPQTVLHRRPALIEFSISNTFTTSIFLTDSLLLLSGFNRNACSIILLTDVTYFLQPFIILYALRQDTLFWQGLYRDKASNLNQPLLGVWEMGRETIGMVASTITTLERRVVPIIAFGQLRVDTSKFFSGGTARVYRGAFKQHDVAIKFLFNIDLTPQHVISFCDEATILNSLQHVNIVKCFGVAVMPPALCLVTEFCLYGSLYDFLHSFDFSIRQSDSASGNFTPHVVSRQQNAIFQPSISDSPQIRQKKNNESDDGIVFSNVGSPEKSDVLRKSTYTESGEDSRKSDASHLVEAMQSQTTINVLHVGTSGDIENGVKSRASIVSGSTLENLGFSMRISSNSSQARASNDNVDPEFFSKIKKVLSSSGLLSHTDGMKSAESVLRSADMGFGLGPTGSVRLQRARSIIKEPEDKSRLSLPTSSNNGPLLVSALTKQITKDNNGDRPSLNNSNNGLRQSVGKALPFHVRLCLARDAAAGVAFMHANRLMHCDIKSLNFLVTKDLVVKLADLGEARSLDDKEEGSRQYPRNINWSSPEVLNGKESINQSADVWSLAFVVAEIFTGTVPFDTQECRDMSFEAFKENLSEGMRPAIPDEVLVKHPWFNEMISSAWAYEPENRLHAIEIADILETNIQSIIQRKKLGKYKE